MKRIAILFLAGAACVSGAAFSGEKQSGLIEEEMRLAREVMTRSYACSNECSSFSEGHFSESEGKLLVSLKAFSEKEWPLRLPSVGGGRIEGVKVNGAPGRTRWSKGGPEVLLPKGTSKVELVVRPDTGEATFSFSTPIALFQTNSSWSVEKEAPERFRISKAQTSAAPIKMKELDAEKQGVEATLSPLFVARRNIRLSDRNGWRETIVVQRLSENKEATTLGWPLPDGAVPMGGETTRDGQALIAFGAGQSSATLNLRLRPAETLSLSAEKPNVWEEWRVSTDATWKARWSEGVKATDEGGDGREEWMLFSPFVGEKGVMTISRPVPAKGETMAVSAVSVKSNVDENGLARHSVNMSVRSSISQTISLSMPANMRLLNAEQDGNPLQAPLSEDRKVVLTVPPGESETSVFFEEKTDGYFFAMSTPKFSISVPAANVESSIEAPKSFWPLIMTGPEYGPSSKFWGIWLTTMLLGAALWRFARKRSFPGWPLWKWMLLCAPLASLSPIGGLTALAIIAAYSWISDGEGKKKTEALSKDEKRVLSVALMSGGAILMLSLLISMERGLMGYPSPMIEGFESSDWSWSWYQDRSHDGSIESGVVFGVPMIVWRALMLGWLFWIASETVKAIPKAWSVAWQGDAWNKKEEESESVEDSEGDESSDGEKNERRKPREMLDGEELTPK